MLNKRVRSKKYLKILYQPGELHNNFSPLAQIKAEILGGGLLKTFLYRKRAKELIKQYMRVKKELNVGLVTGNM